jgi:8-oxo-dGTP diphosphatase
MVDSTLTMRRYTYDYPRPSVTVDAVVFGVDLQAEAPRNQVLLIERAAAPYKGGWALPGGFVHMNESLDDAVQRELEEETGLRKLFFEQLYTFGDPKRDPRGRVISVAYYALVNLTEHKPRSGSDAANAMWFNIDAALSSTLAFDHEAVIRKAVDRLRAKLRYAPIGFELLPERFTIAQLQRLYEVILDRPIDKANFRKKLLGMDLLQDVGREESVAHRPAVIYRFDRARYTALTKAGFNFEL